MVNRLYTTPHRPDEDEFESEPVLPANDFLLLAFVVVGRSAKMAENHLWNPEFMLGMLGDIDSVAVICHMNRAIGGVNLDFEGGDGECVGFAVCDGLRLSDYVVAHIHHSFIEEFVETGDVGDVAAGKCGGGGGGGGGGSGGIFIFHYILHRVRRFDCSNIRVRFFENVFTVCHLLVFLEVFCFLCISGIGGTSGSGRFRSNFRRHFDLMTVDRNGVGTVYYDERFNSLSILF